MCGWVRSVTHDKGLPPLALPRRHPSPRWIGRHTGVRTSSLPPVHRLLCHLSVTLHLTLLLLHAFLLCSFFFSTSSKISSSLVLPLISLQPWVGRYSGSHDNRCLSAFNWWRRRVRPTCCRLHRPPPQHCHLSRPPSRHLTCSPAGT